MDVRNATDGDRLRVVSLLRESHAAAGFSFRFDAARAEGLFKSHMLDGLVLVLGTPAEGVLMARTFDHPFGAGLWARETVWFIRPEARGRAALRMLDAYEAWARACGCAVAGMAALEPETAPHPGRGVSALYLRRGYRPAETHFLKAL